MRPWVKRHPYVALVLLVAILPAYVLVKVFLHLPEAFDDWHYEWSEIWRHASGETP